MNELDDLNLEEAQEMDETPETRDLAGESDAEDLPEETGLPSPEETELPEPEALWAALNMENKVSLYANVGGEVRLFNKNLGD